MLYGGIFSEMNQALVVLISVASLLWLVKLMYSGGFWQTRDRLHDVAVGCVVRPAILVMAFARSNTLTVTFAITAHTKLDYSRSILITNRRPEYN